MPLPAANRIACLIASLLLAIALPALAERTDRDKPVNLESDTVDINDLTKVSVYQGNVRLSQGTLLITAAKLVVVQDDAGFSKSTATGSPAYFKQKRDGTDEVVEGWAQQIDYDAKHEKVEMHTQARIKRGADEVRPGRSRYRARISAEMPVSEQSEAGFSRRITGGNFG